MNKIDELLAVLDVSTEKQWEWLTARADEFWPDDVAFYGERERYLADLAFRLRDEAVQTKGDKWKRAKLAVYNKVGGGCSPALNEEIFLQSWFVNYAQPIHWIIAALIAKERK